MTIKDPRKAYWDNNYLNYWKKRVSEHRKVKSKIINDFAVPNKIFYKVIEDFPFLKGKILDVGCGWGRFFPLFHKHKLEIYGVDISSQMIKAAKKQWNKSKNVAYLKDSTAELLPFPDKTFDNLVCFATFDATIQNRSINEFIRVVRPGGRIYLTGKNNGFKKNDINAILAESAARKKKTP